QEGTLLVTAANDDTIRLWDGLTGWSVSEPLHAGSMVDDACFAADNHHVMIFFKTNQPLACRVALAYRSAPTTLRLHSPLPVDSLQRLAAGARESITARHVERIKSVLLSPDRRRVATTTPGGKVRVWDTATGLPLTDWLLTHG